MRRKITYDPRRDYYAILGIEDGVTAEEIRQAYRRSVRAAHPDLHRDRADWATEQLQLINEAYDVLSSPTLRKEYDRKRWPYAPSRPKTQPRAYRSPFTSPSYDPDRPWWEQVKPYGARPPAPGTPAGSPADLAADAPPWLKIAAWLRQHGLGGLEPGWLTLVGLWRSPYVGVLGVLGMLLACNVAVILLALMPELETGRAPSTDRLFPTEIGWPDRPAEDSAHSTPAAAEFNLACPDPGVQIHTPAPYARLEGELIVQGTVTPPGLWGYSVELGYIGPAFSLVYTPQHWETVRALPTSQSIPEPPIENGVLTGPVKTGHLAAGFYVLRLRVTLTDGTTLPPCDVIVQR